jgi:hypothetical protein
MLLHEQQTDAVSHDREIVMGNSGTGSEAGVREMLM